jgi:hypothetical protein
MVLFVAECAQAGNRAHARWDGDFETVQLHGSDFQLLDHKISLLLNPSNRQRLTRKLGESLWSAVAYFNFTNSNTKIAHIPTVTGNCTSCASRTAPPLGKAKVSSNIASGVSTPISILDFEFISISPRSRWAAGGAAGAGFQASSIRFAVYL